MLHSRLQATVACVVLAVATAARADGDPSTLAGKIDARVSAKWRENKVKPAPASDDGAFLRRVYLDLVGQVPTVREARDFLEDPAPDKRARLVERLLSTDAHARHFGTFWRKTLLPDNSPFAGGANSPFEAWLRGKVRENAGFDSIARAVLVASSNDTNVGAFYTANENKAETVAASASRVFLGVRIECAQCHDHPFASWKKQQFWEFAAYFGDVRPGGQPAANARGEITIPGTDKVVQARLLVADAPPSRPGADPREVLADWVVRPDNPYFGKAVVNRLWQHFFGIGLVDPVDGMGEDSPPSHPELLDELARDFAAHQFDLRYLIRAITLSKTYQLSSEATDPSQDDARMFARAAVRGLSAEQLYDSLSVVTGKGAPLDRPARPTPGQPQDFQQRTEFVTRFNSTNKPLDAETSILQALHVMNGRAVTDATSLEKNRMLRTLADAEGVTTAQRVEELYLLTLSRKPRPEETARLVKYVDGGGPRNDKKKALADVFWVLLNSSEFGLNH